MPYAICNKFGAPCRAYEFHLRPGCAVLPAQAVENEILKPFRDHRRLDKMPGEGRSIGKFPLTHGRALFLARICIFGKLPAVAKQGLKTRNGVPHESESIKRFPDIPSDKIPDLKRRAVLVQADAGPEELLLARAARCGSARDIVITENLRQGRLNAGSRTFVNMHISKFAGSRKNHTCLQTHAHRHADDYIYLRHTTSEHILGQIRQTGAICRSVTQRSYSGIDRLWPDLADMTRCHSLFAMAAAVAGVAPVRTALDPAPQDICAAGHLRGRSSSSLGTVPKPALSCVS